MHELGITQELAKMADEACQEKGKKAKVVVIELGTLSTYKTDPMQTFYDAIKNDYSKLKNSILIIKSKPGKGICQSCKYEALFDDYFQIICPKCGSLDVKIIDGEDIRLLSIET